MATATIKKRTVQLALNNGTDSQGNIKTVNTTLGSTITTGNGYTDDKALAIANLIAPCLAKSLHETRRIDTNVLVPV